MNRPFKIESDDWPGLAKVGEECAEVVQIVSKLIGTDGENIYFDGTNLRERMQEELGDVLAAIDFLLFFNAQLDTGKILERRYEKYAAFYRWRLNERLP